MPQAPWTAMRSPSLVSAVRNVQHAMRARRARERLALLLERSGFREAPRRHEPSTVLRRQERSASRPLARPGGCD